MKEIISILISFLVSLFFIPFWIKRAKNYKIVGFDVHKKNKPEVSEAGGIIVLLGFLIGTFFYISIVVFYNKLNTFLIFMLAAICSIFMASIMGLVDDILGWGVGLRQYQKLILSLLIPLPLMIVNSGHHIIYLPFLGKINFGLVYPLLIIPIGIVGASNGFNMLAGYNGLEAGMGIIILSVLGYLSWLNGKMWVSVMAFCMAAALLAFFIFNFYPSKIFPGDTLTYSVGSLIAIVAILGDIERFALMLFIPYFFEFILKARGRFVHEWASKVLPDGSLDNKFKKWYSLPHVMISLIKKIKKRVYEYEIVISLLAVELVLAIITISSFFIT